LSLEDWAAWATIVGTVIVIAGTVLGWLGKLRLRLPAQLESIESRALFVICVILVAVPIIAWGPLAGFLPSFANLLVMPSMPTYLEELSKQPKNPASIFGFPLISFRQSIVLGLALVLTVVNVVSLFKAIAKVT
jgi:uncharacterized membrane protein